jgi:cytochrome c-type biogenesis protein
VPGLFFAGTVLLILAVSFINWASIFQPLRDIVFVIEENYHQWLVKQSINNPLVLLPLAFGGGLISSLSPCQLSLLGVNLTYIGTREFTSRWDAFIKAGSFVLGVVTVLSLLGLFSSFAGAVMVGYRGYVNIAVGAVILVMGLSLLEIIRLPLPKIGLALPITGPYTAGLTFALVSSPCTSPVLFAVIAAAGATGSPMISTLTMVSYALGTTVIIFLASLFAGLAKQTGVLLQKSQWVMRIGAGILIVMGGYYLVNGIRWLILVL